MGFYIIEINDKYKQVVLLSADGELYCKDVAGLMPYTEPDLEQVRKEAYEDGYKTAKVQCNIQAEKDLREVGERHYQKGLSDAWAAARTIVKMSWEDKNKIFGKMLLHSNVFLDYTADEAIEKIREYEQDQEKIKVGDEVKCIRAGWTAIVTKIKEDGYLTLMGNDGAIANGYDEKDFIKTGRCFPEIAEILLKMKESANDN